MAVPELTVFSPQQPEELEESSFQNPVYLRDQSKSEEYKEIFSTN